MQFAAVHESACVQVFGRHSRTRERLLLGEERKSRLRHPTSESDPTRTFDLIIVCVAGWGICHSTDVRGCELGTRLRMRL